MILASASPRRLELLKQLGIVPARVVPAAIDETSHEGERPLLYAKRVAEHKARLVAAMHPGETVLAADTVVAVGKRILPKAENEEEARYCLRLLSGRRHHVITAVVVIDVAGMLRSKSVDTVVKFAPLSDDEIEAYIKSEEWRGKAGGYAIQGKAASFVSFLSGSYSGVVGLPLFETARLLTS